MWTTCETDWYIFSIQFIKIQIKGCIYNILWCAVLLVWFYICAFAKSCEMKSWPIAGALASWRKHAWGGNKVKEGQVSNRVQIGCTALDSWNFAKILIGLEGGLTEAWSACSGVGHNWSNNGGSSHELSCPACNTALWCQLCGVKDVAPIQPIAVF